ncbi:hypothetical protein VTK56DRAFT_2025 [Thermocarpiscus australiensis]
MSTVADSRELACHFFPMTWVHRSPKTPDCHSSTARLLPNLPGQLLPLVPSPNSLCSHEARPFVSCTLLFVVLWPHPCSNRLPSLHPWQKYPRRCPLYFDSWEPSFSQGVPLHIEFCQAPKPFLSGLGINPPKRKLRPGLGKRAADI